MKKGAGRGRDRLVVEYSGLIATGERSARRSWWKLRSDENVISKDIVR